MSWLNAVPEPVKAVLVGAAGEFAGSMTAGIVTRLCSAAGYAVSKRFQTEPRTKALNQAMAMALFKTVSDLTGNPDLMGHYLGLFERWVERDAVAGGLSQLIDPRRESHLDLKLLEKEFEAIGCDTAWLGQGFDFDTVIERFVQSFRDTAASEPELQGVIVIAELRTLVEQASSQTTLQQRLVDRLAPDLTAEDRSYLEGLISKLDRLPLGSVDTRAIGPGSAEGEIALRSVYVALNTTTTIEEGPEEGEEDAELVRMALEKRVRSVVRRPESALEALARRRAILLLGGPGSGKTTFLRHVALTCAQSWLSGAALPAPLDQLGKNLFPLVVTLRRFAAELASQDRPERHLLLNHLQHLLGTEHARVDYWNIVMERLLNGEAVLLLDGYDEIDLARRSIISAIVADFRDHFKRIPVLVTCRVRTYEAKETPRIPVPDVRLAPLDEERISDFAAAWYRELVRLDPSRSQVWAGQKVQALLGAVERGRQLREMAEVPLLLTMMARVNARNPLPDSRSDLYGQVVDQLMWEWEKARSEEGPAETLLDYLKETGQGKEHFLRWLADFVFKQHERQGASTEVADISCSELENALRQFHGREGKNDWAEKVLGMIVESSGILLKVDDCTLNVPHRSFQEYLAAVHLALVEKPTGIVDLARAADHWHEVILLAAGYLVAKADETKVMAWVEELAPTNRRTRQERTLLRLAGETLSVMPRELLEKSKQGRNLLRDISTQLAKTATSRGGVTAQERASIGTVLGRLGDPRSGEGLKDGLPDIAWVAVPAGPFLMGSDKARDPEAWDAEMPQFTCELIREPYRISRYPVTVAQFKAFIDAGGYKIPGYWTADGRHWLKASKTRGPENYGGVFEIPNHPRVGVSWYEAMAFCAWLSETTGQSISLPTEAQWERASRGSHGWIYPWGNEFDHRYCNIVENQIGTSSAVGVFARGDSHCGASDMAGNVLEWCRTKWLSDYKAYDSKADDSPEGDSPRVLRGGSFNDFRRDVRCAFRTVVRPLSRDDYIGFRVASPGP